jgi:hypothetical protein
MKTTCFQVRALNRTIRGYRLGHVLSLTGEINLSGDWPREYHGVCPDGRGLLAGLLHCSVRITRLQRFLHSQDPPCR